MTAFRKNLICCLAIFLCMNFFILNSFAHQTECEKCKKCPICSILTKDGLIQQGKGKLVEAKQKLEETLSAENMADLGQKAIASMEETLAKVNEKLDTIAEKENESLN